MAKAQFLSPKNRICCEHILKGDTVPTAMRKTGYSEIYVNKHACKFLMHRKIQEYLRKRHEEIAEANTIDIEYVYRELAKIVNKNGVDEKDKVAALKVLKEALNETLILKAKIEVASSSSQVAQSPIVININELKP